MFTPTSRVRDWRDLQEKTRQLFAEMDYVAEVSKQVKLAGRGEKEIDVYVTDPFASYNRIYLIECKHWDANVPQEVVHGFKTVMEEAGANTGFIISKRGFQSGAREAARFTNIKLLTFEELQHLYGNEWFRKQRAHLEVQVQRLVHISTLHFDQWNMLGFHNNMVFRTREQQDMLLRFNAWITGLIVDARGKWPESYLGPEPVRTSRDPADPDREIAGWHEFPTVRDYFRVMTISAKKCADEFDKFEEDARRLFDALPNSAQETIHDEVVRNLRDELPLRVLKDHVPEAEYERLIALVAEGKKQSGGAVE